MSILSVVRSLRRYSIVPRPYQKECIDIVKQGLLQYRRPAISLPTGSGKTVIFSSLLPEIEPLNNQGSKTLIIVNRRELVRQTCSTIERMHPSYKVMKEIGKDLYDPKEPLDVCVASISSLSRPERLARFDPKQFKAVIVDEAHHASAETYKRVFSHFGLDQPECDIYTLGFSATFFRRDRGRLDEAFDEVVLHKPLQDLIDDGHLTNLKIERLTHKHTATNLADKSNFLQFEQGLELIYRIWLENSHIYKSTVIFAINLAHMQNIVGYFRNNGVDARFISGNLKSKERDALIASFSSREFPVFVNCSVLTEGTDIPCIDQIIVAKPMASVALAMQCVGRGLRKFKDKDHCNLVVFSSFCKFPKISSLGPQLRSIRIQDTERMIDASARPVKKPTEPVEAQLLGDLKIRETTLDEMLNVREYLPEESRYIWMPDGNNRILRGPPGRGKLKLVFSGQSDGLGRQIYSLTYQVPRNKTKTVISAAPLNWITPKADSFAQLKWGHKYMNFICKNASWRRLEATDKQLKFLKRLGYALDVNRGQAADMITQHFVGTKRRARI